MGSNPLYRKIAEDLRAEIESGALRPGQQLRTEADLMAYHGASRNTVRDAIKSLINLGLVETRPGQGTFVAKKIDPYVTTLSADRTGLGTDEGVRKRDEVSKQKRVLTTSPVQVEIQADKEHIAAALKLKPDSEVISRHERRFIDGIPWSMQTSYYPVDFAEKGGAERLRSARNIGEGTVQYLKDSLGIFQKSYRDWIIVRAPNPTEADFFSLPPDGRISMFEITRTAFDGNQQPMRVTVTVYPVDRSQFIVNSGDVPPLEDQIGGGSREP
jgi:GntR family transcriptional regulator